MVLAILLVIVPAGLWLGTGTGNTDPTKASVEKAIRDFEKAIRDSDVETFQALTTDAYFERYVSQSGSAGGESSEALEFALGRRVRRQIGSIEVAGDRATVVATIRGENARNVDAVEVRLARQGGVWQVDYTGMRTTPATGDTQVIDMTMADFSFEPARPVIKPGNSVVFRTRNAGAQPHMMGLWLVPEGHDLIKLIEATDQMPAGVERVVQSHVFAVGDYGDVTLDGGLKRGRYMLTCFLSDVTSPILTPHYDLGMLTEFEVK